MLKVSLAVAAKDSLTVEVVVVAASVAEAKALACQLQPDAVLVLLMAVEQV